MLDFFVASYWIFDDFL